MNKLFSIGKFSPFWLASFWSVILLSGFLSFIPQPDVIIGYIWKGEFAFAALILLTILCALKFPKEKIRLEKFSKNELYFIIFPLVSFTIWSGLSCLWAESRRGALHHTLLWACYVLFYILIRQICFKPRLLNVSLTITGVVISVLGVLCSIEYYSTSAELSVNVSLRYSKYAEILATLLPIFIVLAIGKKNRGSFLFGAVGIIGWFGIVLSLGRTQFLAGLSGVVVLALLLAFYCPKKISLQKAAAFFGLLILLTVLTQISALSGISGQTTFKRFSSDTQSRTSYQVRFLYWQIALQDFRQSPIFGIGADNFVTVYGKARENFSTLEPENELLDIDENVLAERAHNEYLQILSELGIVGALIFAWFLLGILRFAFSARRKYVSPLTLGALAGMFAFFVSSLASSYSFRVTANGASFFFLLALAVHGLLKTEDNRENLKEERLNLNFLGGKSAFAAIGLLICGAMLIFSAVRGASLMYLQDALSAPDELEMDANYRKAIALDEQEGLFKYYYATRLYNVVRPEESIPQMRFAIDKGIATSVAYFYLASAQIGTKQTIEADQTLREALRVYPRSVFLRTFYANFLRSNGSDLQAEIEYEKSLRLNPEQAKSWQIFQAEGTKGLNKAKSGGEKFVEVMDLLPTDGIYAVLDFQRQNNPELLQR